MLAIFLFKKGEKIADNKSNMRQRKDMLHQRKQIQNSLDILI